MELRYYSPEENLLKLHLPQIHKNRLRCLQMRRRNVSPQLSGKLGDLIIMGLLAISAKLECNDSYNTRGEVTRDAASSC